MLSSKSKERGKEMTEELLTNILTLYLPFAILGISIYLWFKLTN